MVSVTCMSPRVLGERQTGGFGLPAEHVAGVHVLQPERLRDEPRDGGLPAAREAGDGDQHAGIIASAADRARRRRSDAPGPTVICLDGIVGPSL